MSQKDDLNDFKEIKLNVQEKFKEIVGEQKEFPKYTTQIMNIANQNAQLQQILGDKTSIR